MAGMTHRRVLEGMAEPAKGIVADLLGEGCKPGDLKGYIVIGLKRDSFQIASNTHTDEGELAILRQIVRALAANLDGA